jgi:hypothetical protein
MISFFFGNLFKVNPQRPNQYEKAVYFYMSTSFILL